MQPKSRSELLDMIEISGKDCAEIGVFRGDFSQEILQRNPKSLLLVDCWRHQDPKLYDDPSNLSDDSFRELCGGVINRFQGEIQSGRVRVVNEFSAIAASQIDSKFDFVYVDACHSFPEVLCDLCCWGSKVRPGGIMAGHDYTGRYGGVKAAVDTYCRIFQKKISILTDGSEWASYAIRM